MLGAPLRQGVWSGADVAAWAMAGSAPPVQVQGLAMVVTRARVLAVGWEGGGCQRRG